MIVLLIRGEVKEKVRRRILKMKKYIFYLPSYEYGNCVIGKQGTRAAGGGRWGGELIGVAE